MIDATGKYVFPGFIDPHVHIYLPFMGTFSKDTYETGSRAALVGGTTTLIEMCCPLAQGRRARRLRALDGAGRRQIRLRFHLPHGRDADSTTTPKPSSAKSSQRGISSFKIFLAYKGAFGIDDTELYHTLKLAKELGVIVTAHCENETLVAERQKELLAAGKTDPGQHHESRPPAVEAEGVHHLMTFAELTGAATYIVHLSCKEALDEALAARQRGVRVNIETLIQYLVLDKTYAERPNFEGAKYVMSPPLRDAANQPVLWNALRSGPRAAPSPPTTRRSISKRKSPWAGTISPKFPTAFRRSRTASTSSTPTASKPGRSGPATRSSMSPARRPRRSSASSRAKARSSPAATPTSSSTIPTTAASISAKTQMMNVDYSAFEGWPIEGRPSVVTVRGQVAARDGKFVGTIGRGQFLRRKPSHF